MARQPLQPFDVQAATPPPTPTRSGRFIVISFIAGMSVGAAPSILGSDRFKSMAVDVATYPLTLFVPAVPVRPVVPMSSAVRVRDGRRQANTAISMQADDTPAEAAPKADAQDDARQASTAISMQADDTPAEAAPKADAQDDAAEEWKPEAEVARVMDRIPGKWQPTPAETADRVRKLTLLATTWKEERLAEEFEANRYLGFTRRAEIINGRLAMFFFMVGVFTEEVTEQNMPEQIRTFLDIFSIGL
eukprot:CAMPEP_0179242628 /NCGR_PEP_ID=MMETSP0797-20121207/17117_1 /TAXON_ID=47934 /ORGANISM="Dinophysis acuminata, Strain DAEP01" /LENGTH=246 /DNA_ID=CAMNT_0020950073 /DNA_START=37 /DNA_END=777 /DNA_ORIENTATION=+